VVREARRSGAANVLIFEDDVVFDDRLNVLFDGVSDQVPDDWDMLLLGGSHWLPPERLSDNVCRVTATVATHAYALKHTIYDEFIRINSSSAVPVDCNNTVLQNVFRCYCFSPILAWQEDGYSDIAERVLQLGRRQ
jgi:GR25 family glycosyltransferase involved in LPS biosynthesis